MVKEKIPLLGSDVYGKFYFKHPLQNNSVNDRLVSLQHFEISNRCAWKNSIPAHRLDFYMVFLVMAGEGIQAFGLKEYYIGKNMLCFVGPNVISAWNSDEEEHRGYFTTFSDDFFNADKEDKRFLRELPFFQIDGNAVLHLTDAQVEYYFTLLKMMEHEYKNPSQYSDNILRSYLHLLLNKANAEYQLHTCEQQQADHPGLRLVKKFSSLFMQDFDVLKTGNAVRQKRIADYARELNVSQNHLNDTIKAVTGQSAGRLIRTQLIKQATMCLKHSTKSIAEIAFQLGFEDPSYFTRYFKNHTGKLPSDFRPHQQ